MRRAVVLAASVVNCVSAAEDWFVTPNCSDANGDDNKVPSYRADMETCTTLGRCTDPAADNVQESECTGTGATWSAYTVDNVGFLDPATADSVSLGASTPPGWTGATRFPRAGDADAGASCWALEGPPEQPTYKLPMCKMYNENACCAPIHDAETQWAYETLVNVADRCAPSQTPHSTPKRSVWTRKACSSGCGGVRGGGAVEKHVARAKQRA